jgi:hypothetical protein
MRKLSTSPIWLRAVAAVLVGLTLVGVTSVEPAFAAPTGRVIARPNLNIREQPTGSSRLLGTVPYNTVLEIPCTTHGSSVSGPYGNGNVWDRITYGGITGWVSDSWMYTGRNDPVSGECGPQRQEEQRGSREDNALAWARSMLGRGGYYFLCDRFVANAYGAATSGHATAYEHFKKMSARGLIRTDGVPPAGAIAYFGPARVNGQAGHTMLSEGNGSYITGGASTVQRVSITWPRARYLGWSWADAEYPGR